MIDAGTAWRGGSAASADPFAQAATHGGSSVAGAPRTSRGLDETDAQFSLPIRDSLVANLWSLGAANSATDMAITHDQTRLVVVGDVNLVHQGPRHAAVSVIRRSDGEVLWQWAWLSGDRSHALAVAISADDQLAYVAGQAVSGMGRNYAFSLACVNMSSQSLQWEQLDWGGNPLFDGWEAVAVSRVDAGAVFTGGYSQRSVGGQQTIGKEDFVVGRVSVTGDSASLVWAAQWGGVEKDNVLSVDVTMVDGEEMVVAAGWSVSHNFDEDFALALLAASNGSIAFAVLWGSTDSDAVTAVAASSAGTLAFAAGYTCGELPGNDRPSSSCDFALSCVSLDDGTVLWQRQWGSDQGEELTAVIVAPLPPGMQHAWPDVVYVVGFTTGSLPGFQVDGGADFAAFALHSYNGTLLWSSQFGSPAFDVAAGVALVRNDTDGVHLYVAGSFPPLYALANLTVECPPGSRHLGGVDAPPDYSTCSSCTAGTFGRGSTMVCEPCDPGHVSELGAGACSPCPGGSASNSETTQCITCLYGTAAPPGSALCEVCPAGTYSDEPGLATCVQCLPGTYSAALRATHPTTCHPCPDGSSSNVTGATSFTVCSACPAGTYAQGDPESGIVCQPCAAGTFSVAVGASSPATCAKCAAGTWSEEEGADSPDTCQPCPAGTYSAAPGATSLSDCIPCEPGTWSDMQGANRPEQCRLCRAGTWSSATGADSMDQCTPCPPGTYSFIAGITAQANCTPCHAGSYSALEGANTHLACQLCPAGTWSDVEGESESRNCRRCPKGHYSDTLGAPSLALCLPCPAGTYSGTTGASAESACLPCPAGTWSNASAAESPAQCIPCPTGTYQSKPGADSEADCLPCSAGRFGPTEGAATPTACIACAAATFSAQPGSSVCTECPAGTYGNVGGRSSQATACIACPAGSFASGAGLTSCAPCPEGHYRDTTGASSAEDCLACPLGTYGPSTGLAQCISCPAGTSSVVVGGTTNAVCQTCPAGTYGVGSAQTGVTCQKCRAGTYSVVQGASEPSTCVECPAGTWSAMEGANSSVACHACPAGMWSGVTGASSADVCHPCPAGTWSDVEGASRQLQCRACVAGTWSARLGANSSETCVECGEGTWSSAVGATHPTTCTPCPAGTFSTVTGAGSLASCQECPAGAWSAALGLTAQLQCQQCPEGTWSDLRRAVSRQQCQPCPLGTFGSVQGSTSRASCQGCAAGTYGRMQGGTSQQEACEPCPAGTYGLLLGANSSHACLPCPAGTYNPLTSSATLLGCLACPVGTWSAMSRVARVEDCAPCPRGTYGAAQGAASNASCLPCPAGTYSDVLGAAGVDSCQFCPAGSYSLTPAALDRRACVPCPAGATCLGREPPYAEPGSWYTPGDPTLFVRCTPPEACRGGDLRALSGNGTRLDGAWLDPEAILCSAGYRAERCSECEAGFYRYGGHCRACPRNRLLFMALCALALVAVLLATHAVLKLGINLAPLTIAVDFFQLLSNFGRFDVHWPSGPRAMMTTFSLVDLNIEAAAPECFVGVSFTRDWAAVAVLPVVCATLLLLYHSTWLCTLGRRAQPGVVRRHRESRAGEMLLLLQVMYLTIAGKTLQLFDCTELADGSIVLEAAPYIRCWQRGSEHNGLVVLGLLAVALYVSGIPLLFWRVLRWARQQEEAWEALAPRDLLAAQTTGVATPITPTLQLTLEQRHAWVGLRSAQRIAGNLSQRFRAEKGQWLLVVMARRLALSMVFVFLSSRPQTQIALTLLVLLVALELQHKHRPYVDKEVLAQRKRAKAANMLSMDEDFPAEDDAAAVEMVHLSNPLHVRAGASPAGAPPAASSTKAGGAMGLDPASKSPTPAGRPLGRQVAAVLRMRQSKRGAASGAGRRAASGRLARRPSQVLLAKQHLGERLIAATEDANLMEWIAIVSAVLVLLTASIYHAAHQEFVTGTEHEQLNVRLFVTDMFCVMLLAVTCTYMAAMAIAPLWVALCRRARRSASARVVSLPSK